MWDFLSKLSAKLTCPSCLTELRGKISSCPSCNETLPPQYLANHMKLPPFFVQMVGWSNVGKTVYLQVLTLMLMRMSKVWPRYTYAAGTDRTQKMVKNMNNVLLGKGLLPLSTQRADEDEPYIMFLEGMERWGSRMLVTRDCRGEVFDDMSISTSSARYLLQAPTALMLLSIWDLENNGDGSSMDMLLNNYIDTLLEKGVNLKKENRSVVVVLTKSDKSGVVERLPPNLVNYLRDDTLWSDITSRESGEQLEALNMARYVEKMARVSDAIRDWISRDASGLNLVRRAENNNITLKFSLVSSIGSDPEAPGEKASEARAITRERLSPKRVLDPYLWALELQSK